MVPSKPMIRAPLARVFLALVRCRIRATTCQVEQVMIWEMMTGLIQLFIIEPFQVEMDRHLRYVGAPDVVMEQVADCAVTAMPTLAARIGSDPSWGAATVIRLWLGTTSYQTLLGDHAAVCGPAMAAAEPFLVQAID